MSTTAPSHSAPAATPTSAWRSRSAWTTLLVVTFLALAADLVSKHLAFHYVLDQPFHVSKTAVLDAASRDPRLITTLIPSHEPLVVIPDVLHFTLVLNPGAVFGTGPGWRWFFIAFTGVALAFGLLMFARWTTPRSRAAHTAIGLLIGGGLGNLYDRINYACVRDFIHPLPGWNWPFSLRLGNWGFSRGTPIWPYVSNIADLFLLIGIAILLVHLWRRDRAASSQPAGSTSPA